MLEVILEPEACPTCGQHFPTPDDGQWRFAKSGKVYDELAHATYSAMSLNQRGGSFEFKAVLDSEGRARVASRRRPVQS